MAHIVGEVIKSDGEGAFVLQGRWAFEEHNLDSRHALQAVYNMIPQPQSATDGASYIFKGGRAAAMTLFFKKKGPKRYDVAGVGRSEFVDYEVRGAQEGKTLRLARATRAAPEEAPARAAGQGQARAAAGGRRAAGRRGAARHRGPPQRPRGAARPCAPLPARAKAAVAPAAPAPRPAPRDFNAKGGAAFPAALYDAVDSNGGVADGGVSFYDKLHNRGFKRVEGLMYSYSPRALRRGKPGLLQSIKVLHEWLAGATSEDLEAHLKAHLGGARRARA
ncbi:hypothetical protein SO694_00004416 [Aureococcus anophagefferens]|uniref:Uncharacterized protein n=1 Tax=Aureococcus anophagefferens TaxID=44056 RepID=A0ABR1G9K9_AURAN